MTKYLKLMTYAAVAVAFASPTYADIVNLYEMKNSEFFGEAAKENRQPPGQEVDGFI